MILSGLGYDPEAGKWTRGRNVRIRQIETAQSYKVLLDAWNCGANYWLRECVYKRLAQPGRKPGFKCTMATFTTSAFWHGINPTYYMTFVLGGFLQSLGKKFRTNVRPFFLPPDYANLSAEQREQADLSLAKGIYDVLCVLGVHATLNFVVMPFLLLDVRSTLQAWSKVGYYGLYLIFIPYAFFLLGGGGRLKAVQKQRAKRAGVDVDAVEKQRLEAKKTGKPGVNFAPDVPEAARKELKKKL